MYAPIPFCNTVIYLSDFFALPLLCIQSARRGLPRSPAYVLLSGQLDTMHVCCKQTVKLISLPFLNPFIPLLAPFEQQLLEWSISRNVVRYSHARCRCNLSRDWSDSRTIHVLNIVWVHVHVCEVLFHSFYVLIAAFWTDLMLAL